jgi:hypothetical protein
MQIVKSRDYNPPTFFWIARYKDDTALSQYHPETGIEVKFSEVDKDRLKGFGWFPFNTKFSLLLLEKTGLVTRPSKYRAFMLVDFKPGEKLVAFKEQQIINYGFHRCLNCGNVWQFTEGKPNPFVKLARSRKAHVEHILVRTEKGPQKIRVENPICPACNYYDTNAVMKKDKRIVQGKNQLRVTRYVLGVEGQPLQYIDEEGRIGKLKGG